MRRLLKKYGVATVFGLAALGLVIVMARDVAKAYGATNAPFTSEQGQSAKTYWPPLLDLYGVNFIQQSGNTWQYSVQPKYGGGLSGTYKQLRPLDTIPAIRVQLILPPGMKLIRYYVQSTDLMWRNSNHLGRQPVTNRKVVLVGGKPTWLYQGLNEGIIPTARFWLSLPNGRSQRCFSAVAVGLTRYRGRWVRIPHAPAQMAQPPGCSAAGTTTTP